jgi:hypothetical protein
MSRSSVAGQGGWCCSAQGAVTILQGMQGGRRHGWEGRGICTVLVFGQVRGEVSAQAGSGDAYRSVEGERGGPHRCSGCRHVNQSGKAFPAGSAHSVGTISSMHSGRAVEFEASSEVGNVKQAIRGARATSSPSLWLAGSRPVQAAA